MSLDIPPIVPKDVLDRIAAAEAALAGLLAIPSNYVTTVPITVADLISAYPPSASNMGKYARVNDLYGSVDDIMRCRYDGVNYRWVPQREAFSGTSAASGGTINITPLVTPPTLRLTMGTITANISVTPLSTNAYVGQRARVIMPGTLSGLGLYTAAITGLIGASIPLIAGASRDIEFGSSGWFQST